MGKNGFSQDFDSICMGVVLLSLDTHVCMIILQEIKGKHHEHQEIPRFMHLRVQGWDFLDLI